MFRILLSFVLVALSAPSFATAPCPQPGSVLYPLGEILQTSGHSLEYGLPETDYPGFNTPAHVRQVSDAIAHNLAGKSQAERDALLLGRLSFTTIGTLPLLGVTVFPDAGQFDTYLDIFDRHDMTDHAAALRSARGAFPLWATTTQARYAQWNGPNGINPALDMALRAASERFTTAQPPILRKAEEILSTDPSYAHYTERREMADSYARHLYMMTQIGRCVPPYTTPAEADAALGSLPPRLAEFHLVDLFLLESGNGGAHQYLSNSTGNEAPLFLDVLRRWELTEQAEALASAMAELPVPYPRDRAARSAAFNRLDEAAHDRLNAATWISDDPAIWEKVEALARRDGYWPR